MTDLSTPKGNGQTGYWKKLNSFAAYVNGHFIGKFATPEQAQEAINEALA